MSVDPNKQVMAMEVADRMLAEVASVDDALALKDRAELARIYARQSKLGTSAINHANTIKIRAERKLADIVDEGQRLGQIARPGGDTAAHTIPRNARNGPASLPELGIDDSRLREARLLRDAYTDQELIERQTVADANDEILSRRALIEEARRRAQAEESRSQNAMFAEARRQNAANTVAQTERVNLLYPVFEALEALANVPLSPREFAARVPSYNAKQVNAHIDQAANWLAQFTEEWNATK
jgi:hypothetical protein